MGNFLKVAWLQLSVVTELHPLITLDAKAWMYVLRADRKTHEFLILKHHQGKPPTSFSETGG
jgi:hypothetical protein